MALTRKMLKAMGIEEEKIDQIIEAHTETTDALKKERDAANDKAAANETAAKELEELKNSPQKNDFEDKYAKEHEAFESYKKQVEVEKQQEATRSLYKAQLEALGITGKRAEQIIKVTDIGALKVKDGAFEDAEAVKKGIQDEWGEFVKTTETQGAQVPTPPEGGSQDALEKMTTEQYMAYKDKQRG